MDTAYFLRYTSRPKERSIRKHVTSHSPIPGRNDSHAEDLTQEILNQESRMGRVVTTATLYKIIKCW